MHQQALVQAMHSERPFEVDRGKRQHNQIHDQEDRNAVKQAAYKRIFLQKFQL